MPKKGMTERLHIGQGRAGLRRKHEPDCIDQPSDVTRRISERSKIATGKTNIPQHRNTMHDRGVNNDKSFSPDVLSHLDTLCTPSPKLQNVDNLSHLTKILVLIRILKKILHFKRVLYLKQYRDWTKCFFKIQKGLKIS